MMQPRRRSEFSPDSSVIDDALNAMGAEDLRVLLRDALPWLDDRTHARVTGELIARAARSERRWTPAGPDDEDVAEVLMFAEAAQRDGYTDPSEVDGYLHQGMCAFLSRNYKVASRIFHALLLPMTNGDIDLGHHEMVDEVLGVNIADCAAQYVIATYMTSIPSQRARAVWAALDDVSSLGHFWQPIQELERVAVEPLPDLDDFLQAWRALVQDAAAGDRSSEWDTDWDRWLREVVERLEGVDGLAAVARSTRQPNGFLAWCRALAEANRWSKALAAYEEAAETVVDKPRWKADFLDGAALAAQELGRKDLPKRLERAWHQEPSLLRLRRWLGSAESRAALKRRAAAALRACPEKAHRQRAFLHVLRGDVGAAATLLSRAPGLGWSAPEHPGHLLVAIFRRQFGSADGDLDLDDATPDVIDESHWLCGDPEGPRLRSPSIEEIVKQAGIDTGVTDTQRALVLSAMRTAAEKRIAGVTKHKRRRHYGHATFLAAACVTLDASTASTDWMATIRERYRRFPALRREFERFDTGSDRVK